MMMSRQRFGCCPATWAPFAPGGERNAMAGEVRCPGAELENDRVFDDPSARESSTETVPGVIHEPVGGLPALDADEVGGGGHQQPGTDRGISAQTSCAWKTRGSGHGGVPSGGGTALAPRMTDIPNVGRIAGQGRRRT